MVIDSSLPEEAREAAADPRGAFGKYILVSQVGKGGMGEVWKAWDTALCRWVALKFLIPGCSDEDLERFRREALAVAKLFHPNIAPVYDAGEVDGRRFIAMQFIDGRTLARHSLPLRAVLEALRDAALAVHSAHEQGLIHRDLKPSNLLLDRSGHVYVIDFGIARSVERPATISKSDVILGTPPFMSPEQAAGEKQLDARTDVYGLGATLYALVTGLPPFTGEVNSGMLLHVIHHDPPAPRKVNSGVPRDVETIILKAMDKDPDRRYASARLLAEDVERYLDERPILAHPPSLLYRFGKFVTRRKAVVGAAVAGLGAVAVTLALLIPRWRAESERAEKEEREKLQAQRLLRSMQELNRIWADVATAKEWTRQGFRKPADFRARFQKAEGELTEFIGNHREMPQGWYVRARVRLYLDRPVGAEDDARKAIESDPRFAPGWALLGQILMERHQTSATGAEEILKSAAAALSKAWDSGGGPACEQWGFSRTQEDDVARALSAALKASAVDRQPSEAVRLLEEARRRTPSEEICRWLAAFSPAAEQRIEYLTEAIRISPHCAIAYLLRGGERMARKDAAGAKQDFEKALEAAPPEWPHRGEVERRLNSLDAR